MSIISIPKWKSPRIKVLTSIGSFLSFQVDGYYRQVNLVSAGAVCKVLLYLATIGLKGCPVLKSK
ncbi:MAG: hypothetical protein HQL69_09270 [Magnetococcales bacterium]|nr:hypothetical protein [Magnetococcales bacterium]